MYIQENSISILQGFEKYIPYLKSASVPVWLLVNMFDNGFTKEQILKQYPSISTAEINLASKYANAAVVARNK